MKTQMCQTDRESERGRGRGRGGNDGDWSSEGVKKVEKGVFCARRRWKQNGMNVRGRGIHRERKTDEAKEKANELE